MTRHALDLLSSEPLRDRPVVRVPAHRDVRPDELPRGPIHLHVTDRLFGDTPEAAADLVDAIAADRPTTLTLHDLPQPSDGPTSFPRRASCYERIARAAARVVVASHHERRLLAAVGGSAHPCVDVVPLPLAPRDVAGERLARDRLPGPRQGRQQVGVLGYLYPGKGHEHVLAAVETLPRDVGLLAIGGPSPGHEDLARDLLARGALTGRHVAVTGFVHDAALDDVLRGVTVPVCAHRHLSASGSVGSWLSAGRRPIVEPHDYLTEVADRTPGALQMVDDLVAGIAWALAHPDTTWLDPQITLRPTRDEVGAAYAQWC